MSLSNLFFLAQFSDNCKPCEEVGCWDLGLHAQVGCIFRPREGSRGQRAGALGSSQGSDQAPPCPLRVCPGPGVHTLPLPLLFLVQVILSAWLAAGPLSCFLNISLLHIHAFHTIHILPLPGAPLPQSILPTNSYGSFKLPPKSPATLSLTDLHHSRAPPKGIQHRSSHVTSGGADGFADPRGSCG